MNLFHWCTRFRLVFGWGKSPWFWITTLSITVYVASGWAVFKYWDWFSNHESGSATVRNLAFAFVAAIGLPLAIWRSWVAERQAKTAQHGLLNERYQKGAEMLGSTVLTVRLGGIYALEQLALEHLEIYHIQIMQLFCAFVRHPPARDEEPTGDDEELDEENEGTRPVYADIYAVMKAIGTRSQAQIDLEQSEGYQLDFAGADLRNMSFYRLNLSRAVFLKANLSGAVLMKTNLSRTHSIGVDLSNANLSGANLSSALMMTANLSFVQEAVNANFFHTHLEGANLTNANLCGANLSQTYFSRANLAGTIFHEDNILARSLTQQQIDNAVADPADNSPHIDGLTDAETGSQITWRK